MRRHKWIIKDKVKKDFFRPRKLLQYNPHECIAKDCHVVIGHGKQFCFEHNTYEKRVKAKLAMM